ncbi:MAG: radical SAM protein [Acidobacteriota bacterium]|jgi:uncharacterized protein|nr:radical SAM protein [Acidobacteriota bacterium]
MHLTLHLTARCNLQCRYCYVSQSAEDMALRTARAAVDLAVAENGRKNPGKSLGVIFFGGEPLLRRELIVETIRHCRDIESRTGQLFYFKITTNGLLLDEDFLTHPETSSVFVALSHDGVRAAHDAKRVDSSGGGSFDRLSQVVPLLLRHKPYAPALTVVTPDTVRHYAASIDYLFNQGFRYLICSPDYSVAWDAKAVRELGRQYRKIADWYYEKTLAEEKFYFSPFEVKIASHVYPGSCKRDRCELGLRQISVAPDGRLFPCVQFVGDANYVIGDVGRGLDEAARDRLYRRNAAEKESCRTCAVCERCNHYCGCLNRQATGSIDEVAPMLCAHERTVLPIADKLAARLFEKRNSLFIQKHYNDLFPVISLVEDAVRPRSGL